MPTIGNAPNGEKTVLDGTEKVPLSGSFWSYISTIKTYIQGFFVRLTGDESIAGNKTFTGYTTFNPSTDSDGTIAAYAETNYNDYGYYVAQYSADSADFDKSSMVLYRERDADGNFTGPMIYGVQYNGSSDSFIVQGDFLNFENDDGTVFNVDKDGVVNIQSGSTYNINGIPHTHLSSSVNDSDVIFTDNTENNSSSDAHGYLPKLAGNTTDFLRADGSWATPPASGSVFDSDIIFTDNTVNNSSSDAHGYLPKLSGSSDVWLDGTGAWTVPTGGLSTVYDSDVVMQNGITTNDADSDHHGFEPILSGDSNTWLNGKNEWTAPTVSSIAASSVTLSDSDGYYTAGNVEAAFQEIIEQGWMPFAFPIGYTVDGTITGSTLAANGGSCALPIQISAPMALQSVSIWSTDTGTQRTWGWDLYQQKRQNLSGDSDENTLTRVAASTADETFTPSAASTRVIAASGAPIYLHPGLYWLVIQCRHATNNFGLGAVASNAFVLNVGQTKTTTNPNGATLDFVAATWTKITSPRIARLDGRVFGQTTGF